MTQPNDRERLARALRLYLEDGWAMEELLVLGAYRAWGWGYDLDAARELARDAVEIVRRRISG